MSDMFALFITPYLIHALHSVRGTIYSIPRFSLVVLRSFCIIFLGMTDKARRAAAFCLGNSKPISLRSGLLLPYMLELDIISFLHKNIFVVFLSIFFSI
jgi:hypothetical protein